MLDKTKGLHLSTAETARALGVTPRALRLYERKGLVKPLRSEKGWRAYGPGALERLHQILTLKRFGLSLTEIAEILTGKLAEFDTVLALQEEALAKRRDAAERGLSLVRAARARIKSGHSLTLDELTTLTRETAMQSQEMPDWAKDMQKISDKHFTPEEREAIKARASQMDAQQGAREWEQVIAQAKALVGTDPSAPPAQAVAKKWRELSRMKGAVTDATVGKIRAVWQEALEDPKLAPKLPFDKAVWDFIAAAGKFLPK
jgi:MerR family transcriptional regulator, thiopeptide resistance regulator